MTNPSPSTLGTHLGTLHRLRREKAVVDDTVMANAAAALAEQANDPLAAELGFELGSVWLARRDWQQAKAAFEISLALAPGQDLAGKIQFRLGRAQQELGDFAAAESSYEQALNARHSSEPHKAQPKTWHQLGRVREKQGKHEAAIAAYREAVSGFAAAGQHLELGVSAFQLGKLLQAAQDRDGAREAFSTARSELVSDAARRAEACYALGEIAIQDQAFAQAQAALSEAISIQRHLKNPAGLGMSLLKLCQVLMHQRDWKRVIQTVGEAIAVLEPSGETAALKLACELKGELLQLMGKQDEAKIWLDRAASL